MVAEHFLCEFVTFEQQPSAANGSGGEALGDGLGDSCCLAVR